MIVEAKISNSLGEMGKDEVSRLKEIITMAGLPAEPPSLDPEKIVQAIQHDKKITQGKIKFALPRKIGEAFITDEVSISLVKEALVN